MQSPLEPVHPGAQLSAGAQAKPDISRTIITNFAIDLPRARQERRAAALSRALLFSYRGYGLQHEGLQAAQVRRCAVTSGSIFPARTRGESRVVPLLGLVGRGAFEQHPTDTRLRALAGPATAPAPTYL